MFSGVEYVRQVCKDRKIPISTLEKACGFANGYLNPKKMSKLPYERAILIADYLNLDVTYLMTGNEKIENEETVLTVKDEKDIAKDLENIMEKLSNKEDGPASFDGNDIPEADQELFAGQIELMLRRLKTINKEKYNPYKNKK